jgi:hypothetical protein
MQKIISKIFFTIRILNQIWNMKILIACEESQTICKAFRELGHQSFSNDLLPSSGGHPEWHLHMDIFEAIKSDQWDMMIAHPPCTYLTSSGVQWLSHPDDIELPFDQRRPHPKYPNRRQDMIDSVEFVKAIFNSDIPKIAIENPIGVLSSKWKKPDQIIQPYHFGDEATKSTCLWLKNLPLLQHTNVVGKGERTFFASGKSHPKWYADAMAKAKTKAERQTLRSKTFPGIANAIATQWGIKFEI